MTRYPLIAGADLAAPLAWRNGRPISRAQYLADVLALATQLPAQGSPLNLSGDRYRFAVGLGAAMVRGHISLLPPNHTPDTIERLQRQFPDLYALADPGAPVDPDVSTRATKRSASICGGVAVTSSGACSAR